MEKYSISQNSLVVALVIEQESFNHWVHEVHAPDAETIVEAIRAIRGLKLTSSKEFVDIYLSDVASGKVNGNGDSENKE